MVFGFDKFKRTYQSKDIYQKTLVCKSFGISKYLLKNNGFIFINENSIIKHQI